MNKEDFTKVANIIKARVEKRLSLMKTLGVNKENIHDYEWCETQAEDVEWLNENERLLYAQCLFEAVEWSKKN